MIKENLTSWELTVGLKTFFTFSIIIDIETYVTLLTSVLIKFIKNTILYSLSWNTKIVNKEVLIIAFKASKWGNFDIIINFMDFAIFNSIYIETNIWRHILHVIISKHSIFALITLNFSYQTSFIIPLFTVEVLIYFKTDGFLRI